MRPKRIRVTGPPRWGRTFFLVALLIVGGYLSRLAFDRWREWSFTSKVSYERGSVLARGAADFSWNRLPDGSPVMEGMELRATDARRTVIELQGGTTLRLDAGTSIAFDRLRSTDDGMDVVVRVRVGRLWVRRSSTARVQVVTDAGTMNILGKEVEVAVDAQSTRATAWQGSLQWEGSLALPGRVVIQGSTLRIPYGWPPAVSRAQVADSWEEWNYGLMSVGHGQPVGSRPESRPGSMQPYEPPPGVGQRPAPSGPTPLPAPPQPQPPVPTQPQVSSAGPAPVGRPAPVATVANAGGPGSSPYRPPSWLSHAGFSPELSMDDSVDMRREVLVEDEGRARQIFEEATGMLVSHYNMRVYGTLEATYSNSPSLRVQAGRGDVGTYRSQGTSHSITLPLGLDSEEFWAVCAHHLAHAWYTENGRGQGRGDSEGFCTWMEVKMHLLRGARTRARDCMDTIQYGRPYIHQGGLQELLAIERARGELGVFQYVTTGATP